MKVEGRLSGVIASHQPPARSQCAVYPDAGLRLTRRGTSVQQRIRVEGTSDGREASGLVGDGTKGTLEATPTAGRVELLER